MGNYLKFGLMVGPSHPDLGAPDVLPIVKKYQPNCLFYHNNQLAEARWGGSESGTIPYPCWATFPTPYSHTGETEAERYQLLKHGDPEGKYWMPAMSDAPLRGYNGRHEWFWEPGDEDHVFPLENLMDMYYKSVGHNSTLIIGLTPDPNGIIPEGDVQRLREWGTEINRRFGKPIAKSSGEQEVIEIKLPELRKVNHLILQEDIAKGERVRSYKVEAWVKDTWEEVGRGECIGHKRIQVIETVETSRIRLKILTSKASPVIKNFSIYFVD